MANNKVDFDLINQMAQQRVERENQRQGQALFNALSEFYPAAAKLIAGTSADPFYRNDKISQFWNALNEYNIYEEIKSTDLP
jgi:hypothetical protein